MDIVNINYEDDEKLEMPNEYSNSNSYSFSWNNIFYNEFKVLMFDTSTIDLDYSNRLKSVGIKLKQNKWNRINLFSSLSNNLNFSSFDQDKPIFSKAFIPKAGGKFNEYNAEIDLKICKKLLEKTSPENLKNNIGIICLTANQKNLLRHMVDTNKEYYDLKNLKIKIDTIDNFQGREKEIIIIDFVRSECLYDEQQRKIIDLESRNIEFLASRERNNVALSRAKKRLFLVGSFSYYQNESKYSDLVEGYKEKSKIVNVSEGAKYEN